jgi:hypothetical protein
MLSKTFSQKGQAMILIVLAIVALVAITALAIDGGNVFLDRRKAQNAADAAATAAALAKIQGQDYDAYARARATSNGYTTDGVNAVTVSGLSGPEAGCDGTNGPYFHNPEYIQVIINSTVNTYFAPIVGIRTLSNCVEAIAHYSSSCPPSDTYSIITLSLTASFGFFHDISSGALIINNGGIYDYNQGSSAFKAKIGTLTVPCGNINVAGGVSLDQPTHVTPLPTAGAPRYPSGPGDPFVNKITFPTCSYYPLSHHIKSWLLQSNIISRWQKLHLQFRCIYYQG